MSEDITYISLFMSSGSSLMIDLNCITDLTNAVLDNRSIVHLRFAHGTGVSIIVRQIEGWCISTVESRASFEEFIESLELVDEDNSEPWKKN